MSDLNAKHHPYETCLEIQEITKVAQNLKVWFYWAARGFVSSPASTESTDDFLKISVDM